MCYYAGMTLEVIDRNEKGQFIRGGRNPNNFTRENALEKQKNSMVARQENIYKAVEKALVAGDDIPWQQGLENITAVLVQMILNPKSKDVDKIRAHKEITEMLRSAGNIRAQPVHLTQTNNYATDPAFTAAFLDARCPHCNEIRSYGVAHVCAEETTIIEE